MKKKNIFKELQRDEWKPHKLAYLELEYGRHAKRWTETGRVPGDDRGIYCNIYEQLLIAIDSLPDNPNTIVCVAMNNYIHEQEETLRAIRKTFDQELFG